MDVFDEVGDSCLSESVVEGLGVGGEGFLEDGGRGDADSSNNRIGVVADEVGGRGSGVEVSAAVDHHVVGAFPEVVAGGEAVDAGRTVSVESRTGLNAGPVVEVARGGVVEVGVGEVGGGGVGGSADVSLFVGGPVDVGGVSVGVSVEGEPDHDSDVDAEENAAEDVGATALVGVFGPHLHLAEPFVVLYLVAHLNNIELLTTFKFTRTGYSPFAKIGRRPRLQTLLALQ